MQLLFQIYSDEVIKYLYSLSVKYEPFIDQLNQKYLNVLDIDNSNPLTWPYYINIQGKYHQADIKAYINDIDNPQILDKEYLDINESLREYYQYNFDKLLDIVKLYPTASEVIKCSIFPLNVSIENAIDAPNLSLLGYHQDYLNKNESDDIVGFTKNMLSYIDYRWYIDSFHVEDMYPHVWWSMLWFLLYAGIMTKRILNIKTGNAHDFHIIEFLLSKGFNNCVYLFNNNIKLFLYKNFHYLEKHKGKNYLLDIINTYILKPLGYNLYKYSIFKHTEDRQQYADWKPEIAITENSKDNTFKSDESPIPLEDFLDQLYDNNLTNKNDTLYKSNLENKIKFNKWNWLLTKYLSLQRSEIDTFYDRYLYGIIFDTFVYLLSNNQLNYLIQLDDILNSSSLSSINSVTPTELIYLYNYCVMKYLNIPYSDNNSSYILPTSYHCFNIKRNVTIDDIYILGKRQYISEYIDVDKFFKDLDYSNLDRMIYSRTQLYDYVQHIFNTIIGILIKIRANGNLNYTLAANSLLNQVIDHSAITIQIPDNIPGNTYSDWFNVRPDILGLVNSLSKNELKNMSINIFRFIISLDNKFSSYIGSPELVVDTKCLFEILKRFNSYNITYKTKLSYEKLIIPYSLFRIGNEYSMSSRKLVSPSNIQGLTVNTKKVIIKNNISCINETNIVSKNVHDYSKQLIIDVCSNTKLSSTDCGKILLQFPIYLKIIS